MAVAGSDVKQLLLQVDASVELAKRNLNDLAGTVQREATKMDKSLGSVDGAFTRLEGAAGKFKVAMGGILAGIGVGTIVNLSKNILSFADDLSAAADQAGIGAERYQTLKEALRALEVEGSKADKIFQVLNTTLGDVQNGADNAATKALERLGISAKITSGEITTTDGLLDALAESSTKAGTQAQFTSDVVDILGKKIGVEFANAIKDGGVALAELERQLRDSGSIIDEALIQKLADANESIEAFQQTMKRELVLAAGSAFEFAEDAKQAVETLLGMFDPLTSDWSASLAAFFGDATAGFTSFSQGVSDVLGLVDEVRNIQRGINNGWEKFWEETTFGAYRATPEGTSNLKGRFDRNLTMNRIMAGDPTADFQRGGSGTARSLQTAGQQRAASRAGGRSRKAAAKPTSTDLNSPFWDQMIAEGTDFSDPFNRKQKLDLGSTDALADLKSIRVEFDKITADMPDIGEMLSAADADRLKDFAADFNEDLTRGLADAIVYGEDLGDVLESTFKRAAAALIQSGLMELLNPGSEGGSTARGVMTALSSLFGGGRAAGGPVSPSRMYMVGERGPELFVPRLPGSIVPNHRLGGGEPVVVHVMAGEMFDARVVQGAATVVRAASPSIVQASRAATINTIRRPRL